jgi:hypothetical protein
VDDLVDAFTETLIPVLNADNENEWREFLFNFIYEFRSHQKKMIMSFPANISVIISKINDKISQLKKELSSTSIEEKYHSSARFGLISMVLKDWVDTGMTETPEEIVNYLMVLILKI